MLAIYTSASFTGSTTIGVAASASVEVRREDTSALATIFSDEAGTTPLANPFSAAADGTFAFFVAGIERGYQVAVTKDAVTRTLHNQAIGTAGQLDIGSFWLKTDPQISDENLLTNPNWQIDQINEGALYTINGAAVQGPDGWSGSATGAGVFKLRTIADPENAALKCLEITCTTADAAIAATDNYYIYTAVEGKDCGDLGLGTALAGSMSYKFKAKFNVTGTFGISFANSALNRSYSGVIVVSSTSEAEYSGTVVLDTGGTWLHDNGVGTYMRLCLSAGANFQTAGGAWAANNTFTTAAQVNFMSSTANVGYLKRITLVPGSAVLAYSRCDIEKELAKCQRYFDKSYNQGTVPGAVTSLNRIAWARVDGAGATSLNFSVPFKRTMRTTPTIVLYSPGGTTPTKWWDTSGTDRTVDITQTGDRNFEIFNNSGVAIVGLSGHYTANARLS